MAFAMIDVLQGADVQTLELPLNAYRAWLTLTPIEPTDNSPETP